MDFVTNIELTWNPLEIRKAGHNSTSDWCRIQQIIYEEESYPIYSTSSKWCHNQHMIIYEESYPIYSTPSKWCHNQHMILYEEESYPIYSTPSKQCHNQHTLLEWTWNLPWNLPGIGLKKIPFFTQIPPGMTWNGK